MNGVGDGEGNVVTPDPSLALRSGVEQGTLDKQESFADPGESLRSSGVVFRSFFKFVRKNSIAVNGGG